MRKRIKFKVIFKEGDKVMVGKPIKKISPTTYKQGSTIFSIRDNQDKFDSLYKIKE